MLWLAPMGHDVPSATNPAIGRWRASGSEAQQRLKRRLWCPPPIVPKYELIEVDRKLCLADSMVRADQPLLQVPNGAVRQRHHRRGACPQGASERLNPGHVAHAAASNPSKPFRFLTQMYARFWNDLADHASASR